MDITALSRHITLSMYEVDLYFICSLCSTALLTESGSRSNDLIQPENCITGNTNLTTDTTDATPTDVTPTDVTSTEVTLTEVTPTDVTPTDVTPTDVTPTDVTPTDVTPTDVTPTGRCSK